MDLVRVAVGDNFFVGYYKSKGVYRFTVNEPDYYVGAFWFDAYEDKEVPGTGIVGTYVGTPIVNCKDCVEYDATYHRCKLLSEDPDPFTCGHDVKMEPDEFCSYGERKMSKETSL